MPHSPNQPIPEHSSPEHSSNPSHSYLSGLFDAYQGEVYGIVMYERISSSRPCDEERVKWEVLVDLEKTTKAVLTPIMKQYGLSTKSLPASITDGWQDAGQYLHLSWKSLMKRFSDELNTDIITYQNLLVQCPSGDQKAITYLVDHEYATKAFCDMELANTPSVVSLQPVYDLIASADQVFLTGKSE